MPGVQSAAHGPPVGSLKDAACGRSVVHSVAMSPETLRRILDPEPGTALARAKAYGIDLTQLAEAMQLTPQERFERAATAVRSANDIRRATIRAR